MDLLYEDDAVIVAIKPVGSLSERTQSGDGFADLLAERNGGYIGVIHRLDRAVGGVMVYAKTPAAAAKLSSDVQAHAVKKEYLLSATWIQYDKVISCGSNENLENGIDFNQYAPLDL